MGDRRPRAGGRRRRLVGGVAPAGREPVQRPVEGGAGGRAARERHVVAVGVAGALAEARDDQRVAGLGMALQVQRHPVTVVVEAADHVRLLSGGCGVRRGWRRS